VANVIRSENYGSIRLTTSIRINFPVSPTRVDYGNSCRLQLPAQFRNQRFWKIVATFVVMTWPMLAPRCTT
jgi:hypothetical protein